MPRFKVIFRDRRIEVFQADRVDTSGDRVRLVDEGGEEVAAWDAGEVASIQEVEEPSDRSEPQWSD
jgi:hypothetical protein